MTAVAPIKLALHLAVASIILACLVWVAAGLKAAPGRRRFCRLRSAPAAWLILFQIVLGGLVAGSKAGLTYNTWPLMDGAFLPPASVLFSGTPWIENFVDNLALVQFNHRLVAYAIVGFALWHACQVRRAASGIESREAGTGDGRAYAGADGAGDRDAAARRAALGWLGASGLRHGCFCDGGRPCPR